MTASWNYLEMISIATHYPHIGCVAQLDPGPSPHIKWLDSTKFIGEISKLDVEI